MCGIIGVYLKKITPAQIEVVTELILQSGIRGVHATGLSYLLDGKIITMNKHHAADKFMEGHHLAHFVDTDGGLYLIAHTRYSTSDLKYNQPIGDTKLSICHNGVISQESPRKWKKIFGLETKTSNDSELIFSCIKAGKEPLEFFDGSMAVCTLSKKELVAFRNQERPLWFSKMKNGIIFASTNDILLRSGLKITQKCEMFTKYIFNGQLNIIKIKKEMKGPDLQ